MSPGHDVQTRGLLLVISGPSGVGKTTITHRLRERYDGVFSVSATTRPQASGEIEGRDYRFVSAEEFARLREEGQLLEHALVFGRHWYGTPRDPVDASLRQGRLVILDIDVQGALQVRQSMPGSLLVFVLPPSDDELLRRLRDRGRDDPEAIQRRFAEARQEVAVARRSGAYDGFVVNASVAQTVDEIAAIIDRALRAASSGGPAADRARSLTPGGGG
jgi:guanylate kinase